MPHIILRFVSLYQLDDDDDDEEDVDEDELLLKNEFQLSFPSPDPNETFLSAVTQRECGYSLSAHRNCLATRNNEWAELGRCDKCTQLMALGRF